MSAADWTQATSAVFTAVAALAALATVIRAERERHDRRIPDLQVEVAQDMAVQQVRAHIVNYGGPARGVKLAGVIGHIGFYGELGPTTYWRAGESRTVLIGMKPDLSIGEANVAVIGRDMRMRYVLATTVGGATKRWSIRRDKPVSDGDVFAHFFHPVTSPLDAPVLVPYEVTERGW